MSTPTQASTEHLTNLRERIVARFDLEELRLLTFDLNVNYDELRGETLSGKTQALLERLHQEERIPDLLARLKQQRPSEEWDNLLPAEPGAISPYKGLLYFDEPDAPLFFGREQVTAELIAHLRQHRFLAVVGASGSGKSSVVRAGVIPAIRRGEIAGEQGSSAAWPVHLITPGDEPLKALAGTLTRDSESVKATKTLLADLQTDSDSLDLFLYRQMGGSNGRCLLIIDQFEELFTQCRDGAAREMFVGNLVTAVTSGQQARLSLILTLRADFYAQAVQLEALRPLLQTRQIIIGAMTPDELRQAIEGPAAKGNWALQPGLVETMLQDVGREPGALPLLSHALQETWARREGRTLTLAGYQAAGGVRRAIAQTADAVYASLTPEQQSMARNIFLRLTELGEGTEDTRRRVVLAELLPEGEGETAVLDLLDLLARRRLVTLNRETDQTHAEVAHEALIREWPALRDWLDENREGLRLHRQLTEAAGAWVAHGEDESYLYRGGRLTLAQEWATTGQGTLSAREWQFLTASQAAEAQVLAEREAQLAQARELARIQKQRARDSRTALWVTFSLLILAITAAVFGFAQSNVARTNADMAATREAEALAQAQIAQTQALASASLNSQTQRPMRALLLATAAGQMADIPLAYDALWNALPRNAIPLQIIRLPETIFRVIWSQDKQQFLTWGMDQTVRLWDIPDELEHLTLHLDNGTGGAAWNRDGSQVLTWSQGIRDGLVQLWDASSGEMILTLTLFSPVSGAIWNEDESRILTRSSYGLVQIWDATSGVEQLRLTHGGAVVHGAIWSEDGNQVMTWSSDNVVRLWDAVNGAEQLHLTHDDLVVSVVWNKDKSQILTWSRDGTARLWDAFNGAEHFRFPHNNWVNGAFWNSDESQILTWSGDGTARLWDASSGQEQLRFSTGSWVDGALWSRDESQVLTWSRDGTARLWDTVSGTEQLRLTHNGVVNGANWDRNERLILTWSEDGNARLWDASSGIERLRLAHDGPVADAVWDEDDHQILTWSREGTVLLWDVTHYAELPQLQLTYNSFLNGATWSSDGRQILTWGGKETIWLWDALNGTEQLRLTHDNFVLGAAWNKDESQILTSSGDGSLWLIEPENSEAQVRLTHGDQLAGAEWSGDGRQFLTWSRDGLVRIWDAANHTERLRITHDTSVTGVAWYGEGNQILTWGGDGMVRAWDTTTGTEYLRLDHGHSLFGTAWDKDQILTWDIQGKVRLWDALSSRERTAMTHSELVRGAAWNAGGDQVLIWYYDNTARLWDTFSGIEQLSLSHDRSIKGATWNKDWSQILTWSEDHTTRLWDATSGEEVLRLVHDGAVNGATWNTDERQILTWSVDGTVRMWDATIGAILFTAMGDGKPVILAQWNRDEKQVLFVTSGGFRGIFHAQMADWLGIACQRITRNFTWGEWQLYFPGQPYRLICSQWPAHPSVPEGERAR